MTIKKVFERPVPDCSSPSHTEDELTSRLLGKCHNVGAGGAPYGFVSVSGVSDKRVQQMAKRIRRLYDGGDRSLIMDGEKS